MIQAIQAVFDLYSFRRGYSLTKDKNDEFAFQKYLFAYNVQNGLMWDISGSGKNLIELAIAVADKA